MSYLRQECQHPMIELPSTRVSTSDDQQSKLHLERVTEKRVTDSTMILKDNENFNSSAAPRSSEPAI